MVLAGSWGVDVGSSASSNTLSNVAFFNLALRRFTTFFDFFLGIWIADGRTVNSRITLHSI